jgi:hypothetical protein
MKLEQILTPFVKCQMKLVPLLLLAIAMLACNLSFRLNIEKIVTDAESIRDGQKLYWSDHRRFATLQELVDAGALGNEVADGRDAGFILELEADEDRYVLSIYPDHSAGIVDPEDQEQLSMFCDESGVLRASVDPNKRADVNSSEMHPKL